VEKYFFARVPSHVMAFTAQDWKEVTVNIQFQVFGYFI